MHSLALEVTLKLGETLDHDALDFATLCAAAAGRETEAAAIETTGGGKNGGGGTHFAADGGWARGATGTLHKCPPDVAADTDAGGDDVVALRIGRALELGGVHVRHVAVPGSGI